MLMEIPSDIDKLDFTTNARTASHLPQKNVFNLSFSKDASHLMNILIMIVYFSEKSTWRWSMRNSTQSFGILRALGRAVARIFLIIRTRNVYGYNSACERIIRYLFGTRTRSRRHEGSKRCADIERT